MLNTVRRKTKESSQGKQEYLFTAVKVYSLQQQAMPILQRYLQMLDTLRSDYSWQYLQDNFVFLSSLWCHLRGWTFEYDGEVVTIDALETPMGVPAIELEATR